MSEPPNSNVLEILKVSKTYPLPLSLWGRFKKRDSPSPVLREVSLHLSQGDIFTLMGQNGAGKTTLLKIVSSLVSSDQGTVRIFGIDNQKMFHERVKSLSFVLGDERSFYWKLTGRQNLEFFGALHGIPGKILRQKIEEAGRVFEIEDLNKRYEFYSTGQKCRLALARSFMAQAELILMDEPTRSLDPEAKVKLHTLIKKLNREKKCTFLIVTHDVQEAKDLGNFFGFLRHGSLSVTRSFETFLENWHAEGGRL